MIEVLLSLRVNALQIAPGNNKYNRFIFIYQLYKYNTINTISLILNFIYYYLELRKNLVYELIRNDIFNVEATEKMDFILSMLDINNQSLKHAICSLISVISSTLRGVEYLSYN